MTTDQQQASVDRFRSRFMMMRAFYIPAWVVFILLGMFWYGYVAPRLLNPSAGSYLLLRIGVPVVAGLALGAAYLWLQRCPGCGRLFPGWITSMGVPRCGSCGYPDEPHDN